MNVFTAREELPPIAELFKRRTRHLIAWLHNLKVSDVGTEEQYSKTVSFIKAAILLQPVMFGRPLFTGSSELQETSFFGTYAAKLKDVFIRQISFSFTGSRELFYHTPDEDGVDAKTGILMPGERSLIFTLDSVFYNRSDALKAARDKLRATLQVIASNNVLAVAWSANVENHIDSQLKKHQKKFLDLYDPNSLLLMLNDG